MQKQEDNSMFLRVVTPDSPASEVYCDSIRLTLRDDREGRGGGAYGIHKGHAKAVMALDEGPVFALSKGEKVFSCVISGGFAKVSDNVVTVVAENLINR